MDKTMSSKEEILKFTKQCLEQKSNILHKITVSELSKQLIEEVEQIIGEDISEYKRIIDNYAINHVLKKHGTGNEHLRGQETVEITDFSLIPEITENFDDLKDGGMNKINNHTIKYEKNLQKGNYIYIEELRKGRKELSMQTMYIKKPTKEKI
jgi:hypothetical protein